MGRPSLGHDARTVPVTVKVTQREALALRTLGGSPAKGLRRLIDQSIATPARAASASPRPEPAPEARAAPSGDFHRVAYREPGPCRIHREWTEPVETLDRGTKTITKACLDCGYVSTTTRPA